MNILFREINHIEIDVKSSYDRYEYYQGHFYDNIYLCNENKDYLGYTNYFLETENSFSVCNDCLPSDCSVQDVHTWFKANPGKFRIPVVHECKLLGEFYDADSAGKCLYQYIEDKALELSCCFVNEIRQWALAKNVQILSSNTIKSSLLQEIIPSATTSKTYLNGFSHTIDLNLCPDFRKKTMFASTSILSMSEIIMPILVKKVSSFFNKEKVGFYVFDGVKKSELNELNEKEQINTTKSIEQVLQDKCFINDFTDKDSESRDFINEHLYDLNQLAKHVSNGIHNVLVDRDETHLHIVNGNRQTIGNPQYANKTIHIYGPCIVYGLCVSDSKTIPSYIQKLYNENNGNNIKVVNHGLAYGKDLLNDLLYMMATPISTGDVVIWFSGFMNDEIDILRSYGINVYSLKNNVSGLHNWFLNNPFHCNSVANKIYSEKIHQIISTCNNNNYNIKKQSMIEAEKIPLTYDTNALLKSDELEDYISFLKQYKINNDSALKGCVVINANPCTRGHLYLIKEATKEVDHLYIFLVQQEMSDGYSYLDREIMLKQNIKGLNNITVLPGGSIFTSVVGFPEYFNRNSAKKVNPLMNHKIFCEKIAPVLNITVRFFGYEPEDNVTKQLNDTAETFLPKYGIKVKIKPRLKFNDIPISAKDVRKYINERNFDKVKPLVIPETFKYLQNLKLNGTNKKHSN